MIRSATIYPNFTQEELLSITQTMEEYAKVFDITCKAIIKEQTTSKSFLHKLLYLDCKTLCPTLPVALLQTSRDLAVDSIKSYNSNNKKKRFTKLPKRQKNGTMRFNLRSSTLRGSQLTFSTCYKRIKKIIELPSFFTEQYSETEWEYKGANIGKDRKGRIFVNLIFKSKGEPKKKEEGLIVGIDRGVYNLVSTSEGELYNSKKIRKTKRRYSYNRKTLQKKGTQKAHKRLRSNSGKEKRFVLDENHCISKKLASNKNVKTYVLEDLTKINTIKEKKNKKARKTLRTWISNWSYSDLEFKIRYKCEKNGISVVHVDPRFTSQTCSVCKNVDKSARKKDKYKCPVCGHTEHSDINAAKNIRDKYIFTQTRKFGQAAVNQP